MGFVENRQPKELVPEILLTTGAATWAFTAVYSRGEHSRVHHDIAWFALRLQAIQTLAGLDLKQLKERGGGENNYLKIVGVLALLGNIFCFGSAFLTDSAMGRINNAIRGGKTLKSYFLNNGSEMKQIWDNRL